jgi:hypothetical protein
MHILIQILLLKQQNKLHSLRPPSILDSYVVLCCCGPVLKFSLWSRDPGVVCLVCHRAEERYQSSLWLKKEVKNLLPFPFPNSYKRLQLVYVLLRESERERESSKVTDLSAVRKWVGVTEPQLSYQRSTLVNSPIYISHLLQVHSHLMLGTLVLRPLIPG